MASTEKIAIPSSDPDHVVQIPLFDYVKKLDVKVRERYLKKISTIGIDPVLIGGKRFEPDCLPPPESTHLLCYFIFKTSYYAQESLPQSRSLQSNLDYYREGWDNKLRSLLGCGAGLAESCSLIASVLFYLEAWTKVNVKLSCTQIKCPLILPSSANKVEYSRVRDINFKSAKKMKADLDETIENLNEGLQVSENSEVFSGSCVQKPEVPAPTQVEMESLTSANAKQSLCC